MCKTANVPELRFKEYTGEWNQRRLGEVFEEYSEKNHIELPPLMIIQGEGTLRRDKSDRNLMYDKANLSNYKMVKKGDFIVHLRSFEGGLEMATDTGIISPAYHTLHGDNTDSIFYYSYFRSETFIGIDLKPHVYGIRRSIDIEGMKTINIPYTSFAEQKSIGDYISAIDNLISLHRHRYERLKKLKTSYLQKMFPKEGSDVPELRFEGFSGAWEQRKLGDIGEIITGSTPSTTHPEYYSEDGIPWVTPTDITDNTIHDTLRKLSSLGEKVSRVVPAETILVTCIASIGKNTILEDKGSFNQQINGLVPDKLNYDPYFLLTESFHWSAEMKQNAAVGTMQIVNKNEFSDIKTNVPSLYEQQKIGAYFSNLDNLINLHHLRYERLTKLKKAYLRKMFINNEVSCNGTGLSLYSVFMNKWAILIIKKERKTHYF